MHQDSTAEQTNVLLGDPSRGDAGHCQFTGPHPTRVTPQCYTHHTLSPSGCTMRMGAAYRCCQALLHSVMIRLSARGSRSRYDGHEQTVGS